MSVDLSSSPIMHPTIREDELDETTEIPDQASTPSDIFSERSRVWLARHGEAVHSRISSSNQKFTRVVNKKTLKDFEGEKTTVFMEVINQIRQYINKKCRQQIDSTVQLTMCNYLNPLGNTHIRD